MTWFNPNRFHHICLIGQSGTGKTTTGRFLAKLLNRPFLDSDEEIEQNTGKSIPELFSIFGETTFREMEIDWLAKVMREPHPHVLGLGAGMPLHSKFEALCSGCLSIELMNSAPVVWHRIKGSQRPLAASDLDFIKRWESRKSQFRKMASFSIPATAGPDQTALEIAALTKGFERHA